MRFALAHPLSTPGRRRGRFVAAFLVAALVATVLAACGGGSDDAPTPQGNVGPAGATVTSADGKAALEVPAGALSTTIQVGLALETNTTGLTTDPQIVAGTVYRLDAPDVGLAQPATLSIAVPASAASGASAGAAPSRTREQPALLPQPRPFALLGCVPDVDPSGPVPPGTVCQYVGDDSVGFQCPAGLPIFHVVDDTVYPIIGSILTVTCASYNFQLASVSGAVPVVLDPPTTTHPSGGSGTLTHLMPGQYGLLLDTTAPVVHLDATVTPTTPGMATLTLTATASDNVRVSGVKLEKATVAGSPPMGVIVPLASFSAAPYTWTSAPMLLAQIDGATYVAKAYDAAGNVGYFSRVLSPAPAAPTIASFAASPATVAFGGGTATLSWSTAGATSLSIDHGVGDVTGLASKAVTVTTPTTYTLTATNPSGVVTAATTVAVAAQAAPQIAAFTATPATLPPGGGNVTLAWTTSNADTLAIDHGIGTVTGTSKVVAVAATTTYTLTATNSGGSVTQQAAVTVSSSVDRFVDVAAGLDTNPCSQAAPCQSIFKAATGASSGATVWLGDGVYPNSQNTATLPDGVGLRAIHPGAATLGGLSVHAAGSSVFRDIVLDTGAGFSCGQVVAQSTTGTPVVSLDGMLIKCLGAVVIAGNVNATMTPGALAGGLYTQALANGAGAIITVQGNATMLIQGGMIDGNNTGSAAFGGGLVSVLNGASLTLSGVTMQNRTEAGIGVAGTSTLLVKDNSAFDKVGIAGNCPVGSTIVVNGAVHVTLDHVQISHSPSAGLCVRNTPGQVPTISITATTMNANAIGIAAETGSGSAALLTATGLSLTGNTSWGIHWEGVAGSAFDIAGSTITGNGVGMQFADAGGTLKLRNSNVSSNGDVGIALYNNASADLGTQASPGGNTFTSNVNAGVKTSLNPGLSFTAVGNTWNVNVQGASASGRYSVAPAWTPVPLGGPTVGGTGINVSMPAGNSASL